MFARRSLTLGSRLLTSISRSFTKHTLPALAYDYTALQPVISAQLLDLHHAKHHQTYVNNLNIALEKNLKLLNQKMILQRSQVFRTLFDSMEVVT